MIPVSNGDSIKGGYKTGVWTAQTQADFAEMIFTLGFGHPQMKSINWWGLSDKNAWQENGGLLDENLQPKPAYKTLYRLINQEWKTKITGLSPDKKGNLTFRGFKGDYKIVVRKSNEILKSIDWEYAQGNNSNELTIEL